MACGDFALTVPQMREAARLYQEGKSRRQVAQHFGVSAKAVTNSLRYQGVSMRPRVEALRLSKRKAS
jgi:transposase